MLAAAVLAGPGDPHSCLPGGTGGIAGGSGTPRPHPVLPPQGCGLPGVPAAQTPRRGKVSALGRFALLPSWGLARSSLPAPGR